MMMILGFLRHATHGNTVVQNREYSSVVLHFEIMQCTIGWYYSSQNIGWYIQFTDVNSILLQCMEFSDQCTVCSEMCTLCSV